MIAANDRHWVWKTTLTVTAGMALAGCSSSRPPATTAAMQLHHGPAQCQRHAIPVPGTGMAIGANWGSMEPMKEAQHRPWPIIRAVYFSGVVKHNPVYIKDLSWRDHFRGKNPTFRQEVGGLAGIPWFYVNLAMTPVLMCINPPLAEVYSIPRGISPIYSGYLPPRGALAPEPMTGSLDLTYPLVDLFGKSTPTQ